MCIRDRVIGVCNVTSDQDTKTSHIGDVFIAVSKPYWGNGVGQFLMETMIAVSYTHLDVYKRQRQESDRQLVDGRLL